MEQAQDDELSAVEQVRRKHGLDVLCLADFNNLLEFVDNVTELGEHAMRLREHRTRYTPNAP